MKSLPNIAPALAPEVDRLYQPNTDGVYLPENAITHRNEEYEEAGFDVLLRMQESHFWYRGRHRFILYAVRRELERRRALGRRVPSAIDLGGGCGGWVRYLASQCPNRFEELALGDSSCEALRIAANIIPATSRRFQIDLLNLHWRDRWDMAFLLDVLEHIPEDEQAMLQIRNSLRPGGLLFVATPAMKFFWSYNDVLAHHVRRYTRADFHELARRCGFRLRTCRYFMFLLSPLLYLSRLKSRDLSRMSSAELQDLRLDTHRVPSRPVNTVLGAIFGSETPLGHWLRFPWGTSILGVFEKE